MGFSLVLCGKGCLIMKKYLTKEEVTDLFKEYCKRCGLNLKLNYVRPMLYFDSETRCAFADFVERLHQNEQISDDTSNTICLNEILL